MHKGTFVGTACVLLAASACHPAYAEATWQQHTPEQDDRIVARTVIPDLTPQQLYRTAVREAGGGLQLNLGACKDLAVVERPACTREAREIYQREMAAARDILRGALAMSAHGE